MKTILWILLTALVLLIGSCRENTLVLTPAGHAQYKTGTIALTLGASAPTGITSVVAILSRSGFDTLFLNLTISDSSRTASGTIPNVAAGTWHLLVNALDANNSILYTGTTDVEVLAGRIVSAKLELLPASGSIEILVSWGGTAPQEGLVAYYTFNGTLADSSRYRNHGQAMFQQYTFDPWGNFNSAYLFAGGTNYITVPDSTSLNPSQQLTLTLWVRIDTLLGNYTDIVSKAGPVYGYFNDREYYLEAKEVDSTHWYPNWKSAGDNLGMNELDGGNYSFATHQWVFLAFVVDRVNHNMRSFKDGEPWNDVPDYYSSFNVNTNPLAIGWCLERLETHSPLKGAMDNLRIYNRALLDSEIKDLYDGHM